MMMDSLTDRELLTLDQMGFIPGPDETEEAYFKRVERTKERYQSGTWIPESHWDWVRESLDALFYVKPLYICAFYSNQKLTPWQGAAAWIEGRELSSVQLREKLKKGSYLGLYLREEILAHEAVHGARSGFNEPAFEEFFAYMTSEKKWRRVIGPIIKRPWEAWPLLFCLLGGIVHPLFHLMATGWIGMGFYRLIKQHIRLKKASELIQKTTKEARRTRAVLFRLTDPEIEYFSKKHASIELFAKKQTCLRWRVIRTYLEGKL